MVLKDFFLIGCGLEGLFLIGCGLEGLFLIGCGLEGLFLIGCGLEGLFLIGCGLEGFDNPPKGHIDTYNSRKGFCAERFNILNHNASVQLEIFSSWGHKLGQ